MQALAMLETQGLVPAIEGLDSMLKASEVQLIECNFVKGGIVCMLIAGEVSAVQAAIAAGEAAVQRIGASFFRTSHIIPRPDPQLELILPDPATSNSGEDEEVNEDESDPRKSEEIPETEITTNESEERSLLTVDQIPERAERDGVEATIEDLRQQRVVTLRDWARTFKDFPIRGRDISKARKDELIKAFEEYLTTE